MPQGELYTDTLGLLFSIYQKHRHSRFCEEQRAFLLTGKYGISKSYENNWKRKTKYFARQVTRKFWRQPCKLLALKKECRL